MELLMVSAAAGVKWSQQGPLFSTPLTKVNVSNDPPLVAKTDRDRYLVAI